MALAAIALTTFALLPLILGPESWRTSAEIRLDTGDIRYRFIGIITERRSMNPRTRECILRLAANSRTVKSEWHQCASYPLKSSNHPDRMCQRFYSEIERWAELDESFACVLLEDVVQYIKDTSAEHSLPFGVTGFRHFMDEEGHMNLDAWREDPGVKDFIAMQRQSPMQYLTWPGHKYR